MAKLRVDRISTLLPELDELRPLLDHLISESVADPDRTWAGSGELGTLGMRLVRTTRLRKDIPGIVQSQSERLEALYERIMEAVSALEAGDEAGAVTRLLEASSAEESANRLDRAEAFALAAHEVARELRDREPMIRTLRQAARMARGQGKLEAAGERYEHAHRIAGLLGDAVSGAVTAIGRGNVSVDRGLWEDAARWYQEALDLLGEKPLRNEHWHVYLNLSIVHRSIGELDRSAEWLSRAERIAAEGADADAEALLGNARGQLLMAADRWEEAELIFRNARDAATEAQARVVIGVNLGEALLAQGQVLGAAEAARAAEETAIVSSVLTRLPEVYRLLGAVAGARGLEDGFVFFEQALEVIRHRRLPRFETAQTLEAYAQFASSSGKRAEAEARLRSAAEIYDELGSRHMHERVLAALEEIQSDGASAPPTEE